MTQGNRSRSGAAVPTGRCNWPSPPPGHQGEQSLSTKMDQLLYEEESRHPTTVVINTKHVYFLLQFINTIITGNR